jgi:phage regulator Rha-like protein
MMTSLEIAGITGKQHKNVMETIRKMEPAWEKVHGLKFQLMFREVEIGHGAVRQELVASIASAILTALGATSCVGA